MTAPYYVDPLNLLTNSKKKKKNMLEMIHIIIGAICECSKLR